MYSFKSRSPSARLTPSTPCTRDVPLTLTISPPRRSTASRSSALSGLWSCVSAFASRPLAHHRAAVPHGPGGRPPRRYAVVAVAPPRAVPFRQKRAVGRQEPANHRSLDVLHEPGLRRRLGALRHALQRPAHLFVQARRAENPPPPCLRARRTRRKCPCVGSPSSPGAAVYASSHDCLRLPACCSSANVSPSTTTVSSAAPASRRRFPSRGAWRRPRVRQHVV